MAKVRGTFPRPGRLRCPLAHFLPDPENLAIAKRQNWAFMLARGRDIEPNSQVCGKGKCVFPVEKDWVLVGRQIAMYHIAEPDVYAYGDVKAGAVADLIGLCRRRY
ncbi:hypothetical protein FGRMN_5841 [Fusarium graminum]|nr:hypothetical protein FGRMN_5841 [Fusarium graminum]